MMETNDERKNRLQIVLNDLQNGNLVDDKEARGEFGIPYNINQQHSDAEGQQWRQENDNGGTLFERVKNDAMDIYRNMFGAEETALRDAKKLSDSLGVSEQFLVDNPAALERARQMNNEAIQWSFMSGEPFSARNIDTLYPEIVEMRKADPVGAAIALKNHPDLTDTRPLFEQLSNTVAHSGELFTDAFNSGSDLMKLTDAQLRAYNTGDVEASRPAVDEISQRLQEYQENQPKTGMERVFYDTIQQLTVLGTQGIRALKRASQGAAIGMATVSPFAAAAAPETLGVGGAAILIGGAVTGAAQGMRIGMFEQFENQSAAARYWELMSRKENGKNQYSRGRALFDSTVVGIGSGAVEMGLLEVGYGPVKAAWGESAVKSILKNAAARKEILDAGKLALAKSAAAAGVKQWGRGAGAELIEEGTQQAIGDIADNIEYYANGRTGPWHTSKDIISNAVDAMVQAAPAAIGMGSLGAAGRIGGQYHQSRAIASMKVEDYRQEYQRNVERNVIEQLIANKETNKLFKKSPEVYRDIIRAQAEKAGVDTMYVDAQELARSPEGVAVLNDMIDRNIATQEAVDKAITNGTDLEIDTGVFAQLADNEVDQKTLMDATTMNKGGVHIAALRERGKRMEAIRQELKDLAGNKSDELSEEIIQEHFAAADNTAQEAARDVVYRNPYDLERSYKDAVKDARKQYEDALNFGYYWTYEPAGVTVLTEDIEGHSNKQTGRVSENEPWYSDMWKEYGRKATKKEMLDVAYKNERAEVAAHAPEKLAEWENTVQAAKQKYEDLLGMKGTFDKLSKSDYALRQTFGKEGAEVYARTLEQLQKGNKAVAGAAKENAYIYAKMAERWAQIRRDYGDTAYTAKDFAAAHPIRIGTAENKKAAQFEQREFADKVKANESVIAQGKEYIRAALKGEETASTFTLWKLSDVEVKRIKEELGINLSGYTLELVANDIRHVQRRHGEIVRHAIDVLAMPDEVVVGNTSSQGYPSIRFIKYENDGIVTVVENIYTKEKKLKLKTMWKDAPAAVDAKSPDNTSEYNGGDASFHENSIAKEGGKNKSSGQRFGQPITNMKVDLDAHAPIITIEAEYTGKDWKDLRNKLHDSVVADIRSKINEKGEYEPIENKSTGNKVIVTKRSIEHFKSTETSTGESSELRRNTLHYELIRAVPEIIETGIWVEEHLDCHEKALGVARIIAPVKINDEIYAVKLTVKRDENRCLLTNGGYTNLRAYDVGFYKNKKAGTGSISGNSDTKSDHHQPVPIPASYTVSIRELLKHVNDNLDHPYVNADGTPNYGIYFGKGNTGGFIVVDEKTYTQSTGTENRARMKGAYDSSTGILHLFDAADQSTFIHEAAHLYLHEMETMAELDEAPEQLVADLQTIRDWASYAPEKLADYVGNAREKEFRGYAKALEEARKSGDTVAIKAAEERWIQERFARAFERYVAEGKAPTKELQSAFRKFKTWLVSIYRDLKNLGKEPPEDVKKVMDRMLATDDEIEAWAKIKELSAWDRKGFAGDLSGSEGEMIRKWTQQIKDTAKEKLMRQYMEDQKKQWEQDKERGLETERIAYQEQLCKEEPIYKVENLYNNMPEARKALLEKHGYRSEAEFKQALRDAGGTMEERTAAYMKEKKKLYEEAMPSSEDIRQMADEELNSTNGQAALTQLEAAAMRKRLNGYITECMKALREVDGVTGTDAQVAEKLREIIGMVDPEKAEKGNLRKTILDKNTEIKELKKRLAETKEKGKETKKENEQTIKQLKDGLNDVIQGLNWARDMTQGSYMATLRLAREELESRTVNNATTWRHYESKAATSSRRADAHMSAGNFKEAVAEKMNAQKYYCLARAAKDNKDFVRRALSGESGTLDANGQEIYGIKGILKQISKADKPVKMGAHARYFIQHLAYNLEITGRDGRPPLDDAGNPTSLNWDVIYSDLSPDYAVDKDTAPRGDNIIAPWLRQLVDKKERQNYEELTMAQFRDINEAVRVMYKVGRRDYESLSIVDDGGEIVSIEKAAEKLAATMERNENWNPEQDKNNRTRWQHYGEKVSDAILSLTKIEVILQNFGPEWTKYIYNPIDKASSKELGMREKAMREFAAIHNMYNTEEWRSMRNERAYTVGDVDKYTREQLIVMALHWGNKEGRQRVIDELNKNVRNEAQKANEATVEDIFRRNLKDKDLDFIEAVWKQLDQYWPQRNKVQERLYGVGLGRVRALPYTLNGRKVSGGYFPIVYDRELSNRTSEIMMDDIARTIMSGNATMSIGMGSTKHRVQHVRNQTLAKTLDVWPSAVNEAIHHICMREAVTDVYKLISHPDVERAVHENYGIKTYETLKQWAKDCWKTDIQRQSALTKTLERMRRNTAFAVMGYRTSTAALNVLNVFPMMKEIGLINTMQALTQFGIGFYKGTATYQRNRQFVMERSPFMAERANTIDKDIQQHMNIVVDNNTSKIGAKATSIKNTLNRNAYLFIAETDLMLSMALWKWKHDESVRKQINAGKTDETVIADNARTEADKAVRTVLGSSMVKDQAEIQRENGLAAQLAPFYSYSSAVMNALINAGYQWKKGNRIEMVNTMLYWIVLQTIFETLYREMTKGDDDPEKIMKKMGVRLASNIGQGIPVIRDLMEMMANYVLGLPHYDSNNVLAITLVEEIGKAGEAAISPKKDITDVGRSATRALNRYVGMSDTLTDGFWSLMKFSFIDTDGSIEELVNSVLFDRKYKTEKERRQQERKRRNERRSGR